YAERLAEKRFARREMRRRFERDDPVEMTIGKWNRRRGADANLNPLREAAARDAQVGQLDANRRDVDAGDVLQVPFPAPEDSLIGAAAAGVEHFVAGRKL